MTQDQLTQVLDKLRDDEHYYGDFGKQFLSNSDIRSLLTDPLGFKKPIIGNPNLIQVLISIHLCLSLASCIAIN